MFRFYQHKSRHKCGAKNTTGDLLSKRRLDIENKLSFYFIFVSDTFSTKSANFLFRFRRNKHVRLFSSDCAIKCRTCEWRHPLFGANKNLASETIRPLATSSLAHLLRVRKIRIRSLKHFLLGLSWGRLVVSLERQQRCRLVRFPFTPAKVGIKWRMNCYTRWKSS